MKHTRSKQIYMRTYAVHMYMYAHPRIANGSACAPAHTHVHLFATNYGFKIARSLSRGLYIVLDKAREALGTRCDLHIWLRLLHELEDVQGYRKCFTWLICQLFSLSLVQQGLCMPTLSCDEDRRRPLIQCVYIP